MEHKTVPVEPTEEIRKARRATLCPECGPGIQADEDGCCKTCGATATGEFVDRLQAELEVLESDELTRLRDQLETIRRLHPDGEAFEGTAYEAAAWLQNQWLQEIMAGPPPEIEFVDWDGATHKLTWECGDSEAGIPDGYSLDGIVEAEAALANGGGLARDQIHALQQFAAWRMSQNSPFGPDHDPGDDLQEVALKLGILVTVTVAESCGDYCACADYFTPEEFPVECYRLAKWVKPTQEACDEGV